MPYTRSESTEITWFDLVKNGRVEATGDTWDGLVGILAHTAPGVYSVETSDGRVVAVATVRSDGTRRLEWGKRHG